MFPRAWARPANGFRIARSCLQERSSSNTTNRTIVPRFRHLSLAFSGCRSFRLIRSTGVFVRTRRLAGLLKNAILLANFSAPSISSAAASSGTASKTRLVVSAACHLQASVSVWPSSNSNCRRPRTPSPSSTPAESSASPPGRSAPAGSSDPAASRAASSAGRGRPTSPGSSARAASPGPWVVALASVCGPGPRRDSPRRRLRTVSRTCLCRSLRTGGRPASSGRPATIRPAAWGRGPNRRSPPPRAQVPPPGGS